MRQWLLIGFRLKAGKVKSQDCACPAGVEEHPEGVRSWNGSITGCGYTDGALGPVG